MKRWGLLLFVTTGCTSPLPTLVDTTPTEGVAVCGNGIVEPGEPCDDGNNNEFDACLATCQEARCGDGFLRTDSEECDDNNQVSTDACTNSCTTARCGDGVVWTGVEDCDDGNDDNDDNCTTVCQVAQCGDGHRQDGEACDDGNDDDQDECLNNCDEASCGDGVVWTGVEQCDDGNTVESDACRNSCIPAACGDGVIYAVEERCDDGNDSDNDSCTNECIVARCGDGIPRTGVEECDDSNGVEDDACIDCRRARCGDGIQRRDLPEDDVNGEACDDGNESNEDGCLATCRLNTAGDGQQRYDITIGSEAPCRTTESCGENEVCVITAGDMGRCINVGFEACDDGNLDSSDRCICLPDACRDDADGRCGVCLAARCGDGLVRTDIAIGEEGAESCDDGDGNDADACLNNCVLASCGDGVVRRDILNEDDPNHEACDDGNDTDEDACTNECSPAQCGDGITRLDLAAGQPGYEPCDDGPNNGTYLEPNRGDGDDAVEARQDLTPCSQFDDADGNAVCRAYPDGSTEAKAAPSCLALQQVYDDALESGFYYINTRRLVPARGNQDRYILRTRQVYCDFDVTAGGRTGGWTECAKVRADGNVPRHFFETCSGLRPLNQRSGDALIKFFQETEDSGSGVPEFVVYINGGVFEPGTRTRQTVDLAEDPTSQVDDQGRIDGIFRRPNVDEFNQNNKWRFMRRDAGLLTLVSGTLPNQGFQPWLMVAKRKVLELRVPPGRDGEVINSQPIDADLCIGCYGSCSDTLESAVRPLTWVGPKSALCISSSRFSDDGSFASKSNANVGQPRWQQSGGLEIFVREPPHNVDQTP